MIGSLGRRNFPDDRRETSLAYRDATCKRHNRPVAGQPRQCCGKGKRPAATHYRVRLSKRINTMDARIRWSERVSFVAETGSGHAIVVDGAPEGGGRNLGPRPMELVLAGAAACTAYDVVHILRKARQPIADCVVLAHAERAAVEPKVFTKIELRYRVAGRGLDRHQVERAVKLSKEKYCSATIMLAKSAEISYEVRIVEGDTVEATNQGLGNRE